MNQTTFEFEKDAPKVSAKAASKPSGYKGLYAFHKYWGKKPHEILGFLIETLSRPNGIVLDPFVGSGTCAREAVIRNRRFVGVDISPVSVQLSTMLASPPSYQELKSVFTVIDQKCRGRIMDSYALEDGRTATHYLWNESELQSVWTRAKTGRRRDEKETTSFDHELIDSFDEHDGLQVRVPHFFTNSRINAKPEMAWDDILTKRAQANIQILLDAISESSPKVRDAIELCLTAASGQMTKMVFAVTGRGKTKGKSSTKIEVGSWVIGYWRPKLHFEVNVWNCFERRIKKLLKAVQDASQNQIEVCDSSQPVFDGLAECAIIEGNALERLEEFPNESVDLVITDPPHSDRVPYLELSEFWNSLLSKTVDFDSEVVISNAKEREKSESHYVDAMQSLFAQTARTLKKDGFLVVLFNSVNKADWEIFRKVCDPRKGSLNLLGSFPCKYSAGSVVQDNRSGALESDVGLVFARRNSAADSQICLLEQLPGWSRGTLDDLARKNDE